MSMDILKILIFTFSFGGSKGFGRLKSPLSYPELRNLMVRRANQWIVSFGQMEDAGARSNFENYFKSFESQLVSLSDVGLTSKVLLVRLQGSLKLVEADLKNKKSELEKKSRQEPDARSLINQIDSHLERIRRIKHRIKEEEKRCVLDERKILGNL